MGKGLKMRIRNARGRTDGNSGYTRVLGNDRLGQLMSRVQATVIANGNELEKMIVERSNTIENLEKFIDDVTEGNINDGVYLCRKKEIKSSTRYAVNGIKGIEPDLLIFVVEKKRICKVIELKDGDSFDTKKSQGEREHLEQFATNFGARIPFVTEYYICCFNQEDKEKIKVGFKGEFSEDHIMTGSELCEILNIDYNELRSIRKADMSDNLEYFIEQLIEIPGIKEIIARKI